MTALKNIGTQELRTLWQEYCYASRFADGEITAEQAEDIFEGSEAELIIRKFADIIKESFTAFMDAVRAELDERGR